MHFDISSPKRHVISLSQLIPCREVINIDAAADELPISLCEHIPDMEPLRSLLAICFGWFVLLFLSAKRPRDLVMIWVTDVLTLIVSELVKLIGASNKKLVSTSAGPSCEVFCFCGWPVSDQSVTRTCVHCQGYSDWQLSLAVDDPDFDHAFHYPEKF